MTYTEDHKRLIRAADAYAEQAHQRVDQRRKYSNEPYMVHPRQTAGFVKQSAHGDAVTVAVALLHDVLEDTLREGQTTSDGADEMRQHFAAEFGPDLADELVQGVLEVTDISKPEDGNRKTRKALDRDHAGQATNERKTVKLADIKSNMPSIVKHDPGFARRWVAEKADVLPLLKGGDTALFDEVGDMIKDFYDGRFDTNRYQIV